MICSNCGNEMGNGNFCPYCGASPVPYQAAPAAPSIPAEYKPISAWGYVGWNFVFGIPLVGFIVVIVFALGGTSNVNLKNYSRSILCAMLLVLILSLIGIIVAAVSGVALGTMIGASYY